MKKITLIALLLFLFVQKGQAQKQNDFGASPALGVKIMPLSMIDFTPRYRFGIEYISGKKFGYSLDVGFGNSFFNQWRLSGLIWGRDYTFWEVRPEFKYLFARTKDYYFYVATELFYMDMRDLLLAGQYQKKNALIETTYESARFNKQKYGLHFKCGINVVVSEYFQVEFYAGMGLAERIIYYTDVRNPMDGAREVIARWFPQNHLFEGRNTIFHPALGLKFGYSFPIQKNTASAPE